jgi:hypothetical protein
LLPDLIPFLIHMQLVANKKTVDRLPLRCQHRMIHIDKSGMAILGHKIPDHVICCFHPRHQFLTAGTWLDRYIKDVDILQPGPDQLIQVYKTIVYHCCRNRIGNSQVIVTAINNNLFGMIRENDLARIPDHIRESGSAKATVDDGISWKAALYIRPLPERRTSYKKNRSRRRMLDTILLFEICYLIPERRLMRQGRLMSGGIGRLLGGYRISRYQKRQQGKTEGKAVGRLFHASFCQIYEGKTKLPSLSAPILAH